MSPREKRIVRNENLFREVNTHIAELEDRISLAGDLMPLICECANTGCSTVISVEPATFEAVRAHLHRFLVAPGHELDDERVVERAAGYFVVEKQAQS